MTTNQSNMSKSSMSSSKDAQNLREGDSDAARRMGQKGGQAQKSSSSKR